MRRLDWIWIFFVIIAVGLVLSWGRTGQRLQNEAALPLDVDGLLEPESPCRPLIEPCAALGRELALVLGPVAGEADLLALRLAGGESGARLAQPEVDWQDEGEGFMPQNPLPVRPLGDREWLIALPEDAAAPAPSLWVRLEVSGLSYGVRFPLALPVGQ